jgi:hypothetical protein
MQQDIDYQSSHLLHGLISTKTASNSTKPAPSSSLFSPTIKSQQWLSTLLLHIFKATDTKKILDILISMGMTSQDHLSLLNAKIFKKHFGTSPVIAAGLLAIASYLRFGGIFDPNRPLPTILDLQDFV